MTVPNDDPCCAGVGVMRHSFHLFFDKVVDVPVVLCKVTVAIDTVTSEIDFFISSFTLDNMKKFKNSAFVGNTGHFDNEFEGFGDMKLDNIEAWEETTTYKKEVFLLHEEVASLHQVASPWSISSWTR